MQKLGTDISWDENTEKRKFFRLALKDDRVEQCLRSCGIEFQTWFPKQENVREL